VIVEGINSQISHKGTKSHMDNWISRFRSAETVEGQERGLIPGDPEREAEEDRRQNGIPLNDKVIQDIEELSKKIGVLF